MDIWSLEMLNKATLNWFIKLRYKNLICERKNFKMKKIIAILLSLVFVVSMSLTVMAANNFVSSPSGRPAPNIISFKPADEECTARIIVTGYGDSDQLPEELKALMEKAYNEIISAEDLAKLNDEFAKYLKSLKIDSSNLAISDLFDLRVEDCNFHDSHVDFEIVLEPETLKNFVGLLHMNKDGEWEFINNAEVVANGKHLKFSVESLSPFAIVVDTSGGQTGDSGMIAVYAIIMVVSAAALVVVLVKAKKNSIAE